MYDRLLNNCTVDDSLMNRRLLLKLLLHTKKQSIYAVFENGLNTEASLHHSFPFFRQQLSNVVERSSNNMSNATSPSPHRVQHKCSSSDATYCMDHLWYLFHNSTIKWKELAGNYKYSFILLFTCFSSPPKSSRSERRWYCNPKAKHWIEVVELNKSTATIAKKDARKRRRETKNSKA